MKNLLKFKTLLIGLGLFLGRVDSWSTTLTIGRVADDPTKYQKVLKPLLDYVVDRAQDVGITDGSVLMSKDIGETVRLLKSRKVDWITAGIVSARSEERRVGKECRL